MLRAEREIEFARRDQPASLGLRSAGKELERESAVVAAAVQPELGKQKMVRFRLEPASPSRPLADSNPAIESRMCRPLSYTALADL